MVRLLLVAAAALALTCGGTAAAKLDLATVNQAQFSAERSKGFSPVILKAQILLDRARFSPSREAAYHPLNGSAMRRT
ncbi:hypothetical protein BFX40_28730 [Mesorhizobium sp. SEMIA 3007]|nr:hypothetical protein BFX40_28730 [Mesorhizobium sp. SEMIA 3007]